MYIPKANASLRVQTHCEIHSVAWCELVAVLKAYSSFREEFITHLELAYNLGHEEEVGMSEIKCTLQTYIFLNSILIYKCVLAHIWRSLTM